MLMQHVKFGRNLILGLCAATFGLVGFCELLTGQQSGMVVMLIYLYCLWHGFSQIYRVTQSLEISESALVYQSAREIVCLRWPEIGAYVLNDERFIAFDKERRTTLLDIDLRSGPQKGWPIAECAQMRKFIEGKMTETGASRISSLSLSKDHGYLFKP